MSLRLDVLIHPRSRTALPRVEWGTSAATASQRRTLLRSIACSPFPPPRRSRPGMALSSSFAIYLHNLFHPATFFVLFTVLLLASVAFAELLLFALLSAALTFLFHRLTPLHTLPATHAVLLTGSSSGIGEEVALRLASLGLKVFAGVRTEADGYRLQVKARQNEANILPLLLDVTSDRHIAAAHSLIKTTCEQKGWRLYAVILNAGLGEYGPIEMVSAARMRRQYEVNVIAPHVLAQSFLPLLRLTAQPPPSLFRSSVSPFPSSSALQPRLLFVSSLASRVTVPGRGVYCSSKHAVESVAAAYRVELQQFGIRVVSICPGELYSAFHQRSKAMYADVLRECTERAGQAEQQPGTRAAPTLSSPPTPPPLPLSLVRHYDRVYSACRQRWRVVGPADIAADAVEVALRTRWPLPRYDCGDEATVLPLLQLLPSNWLETALGLPFATTAAPHSNTTTAEAQQSAVDSRAAAAGEDGTAASQSATVVAVDRTREAERRAASKEERETLIDSADDAEEAADVEEGGARYTVDDEPIDDKPGGARRERLEDEAES